MNLEKCDFVLVAGGSGSRCQTDIPKQFVKIAGSPVYLWSLEAFLSWENCGHGVIVVPSDWVEPVRNSLVNLSPWVQVQVVAGGATRKQSAQIGIQALKSVSNNYWVMIHDAARPNLKMSLLQRLWNARRQDQGVIPVTAVTETIKSVKDGRVVSTLPRHELFSVQTPQLVPRESMERAYFQSGNEMAVDDAVLLEKSNVPVIAVDGEYDNVKVTFEEDFNRVSNWLRHRHPPV